MKNPVVIAAALVACFVGAHMFSAVLPPGTPSWIGLVACFACAFVLSAVGILIERRIFPPVRPTEKGDG